MDSPSITEQAERPYSSTGHLRDPETVQELVSDAHRRFKTNTAGQNSQFYLALAKALSELVGICMTATPQQVVEAMRVNTMARELPSRIHPKRRPCGKGGEIDLSLRSQLGGLKEKKA